MDAFAKKIYFTENLNKRVLEFYERYGLLNTIALGRCILNSKVGKQKEDFRTAIHGEICETILEVMIIEFLRKNKLENKWFYTKGLVLKDLDNLDSDYRTEIDFVLFTQYKIFLFECKSYGGKKYLKDKCTIVRPNKKPFDVFKQHEKHCDTLISNFIGFRGEPKEGTENVAPVQLVLFNFSNGDLEDQRTDLWKKAMPVTDETDLGLFLGQFSDRPGTWNLKLLYKAVKRIQRCSSNLQSQHFKYVTDLAKKREGK